MYIRRFIACSVAMSLLFMISMGKAVASDREILSQFPQSDFPESTYNPAVFKNLEGTVVWYSTSGGQSDRDFLAVLGADFQKLTGVKVVADFHPTMAQFWAGEQSKRVPWSILMFDGSASTYKTHQMGLLAPIDPDVVPVHLLAPGNYDTKYFIEGFKWATILTWNTQKWPESGPHPASIEDFYDTKKFPGPRCLYNQPQAGGVLESAVQAAGVPPSKVYPIDTKLAFAKLDTIKDDIVWYNGGDEAIRFLVNGECDMAITWNTRVYKAVRQGAPLAATWEGATYAPQLYAIPKNAPNPKAAEALMAMWILDRKAAAAMAELNVNYISLKDPVDIPELLRKYVPTSDKLQHAVQEDGKYYAENLDELNEEFSAWLVK